MIHEGQVQATKRTLCVVDEGQFGEMTVDSVESCHVCIVYVHSNPYFFGFIQFVYFICGLCGHESLLPV